MKFRRRPVHTADLKRRALPSAYTIERSIEAHVRPFFGPLKVVSLSIDHFDEYRKKRTESDKRKVGNNTVDHDLAYLKAALTLEHSKKPRTLVPVIPTIPMSGEDNVRTGFLDYAGYRKMLTALPLSSELA